MTIRKRLLAGLAGIALAAAAILPPQGVWLPAAAGGLVLSAGLAEPAWARAGGYSSGRSSGGYSRPSTRTPSFSASPSAPRTPSTSGGYARPSSPPSGSPFFGTAPSAGDQALSRQRAAQALEQQRRQQATPSPAPGGQAPSSGWFTGGDRRTPSYAAPSSAAPRGNTWFAQQGWAAPPYAAAAPRSFGVWDGLMLWFMLDHLTRPGYGDFLRGNRDDPGVRQWREQADAMARDNTDLRRKLAELDASGTGADSGWVEVPADIPRDLAQVETNNRRTPSSGGGIFGTVFAVALLAGAGGLAYMAMRRRPTGSRGEPGDTTMNPFQTAAAMVRNAVAPAPYKPGHFRVGMVLGADLSPFILAAGATRVIPPEASPEGRMTVAAVGRLEQAGLVRLHLADRKGLFQLHLDAAGNPDECRYFSLFDEVTPADATEWDVWLNPAEGLIGWPEFQTHDGKRYGRVWSPGTSRVAPLAFTEEIDTAEGHETIRLQTMLYGAPTGLPAPAPPTEYIMVSAIERAGQAWVELRAGIDINPATLELT